MAKEIIQVDNKMKDFHGIPLIGTFKVKSNSLSGEFILFMKEENLSFCLTECYKNGKTQKPGSLSYTKLGNEIGYELYEKQEELMLR